MVVAMAGLREGGLGTLGKPHLARSSLGSRSCWFHGDGVPCGAESRSVCVHAAARVLDCQRQRALAADYESRTPLVARSRTRGNMRLACRGVVACTGSILADSCTCSFVVVG